MPRAGRENHSEYMHQLLDLIGDEGTLRTLSKHIMKVFPDQSIIRNMWSLLPTEYVTIPLQGALCLGSHQRTHGSPKTREEKTTQLTSVMYRFCEMREGDFIRRTTFNEALDLKRLPRFTKLSETELYILVDMSVKALQVFFMAKEIEKIQRTKRKKLQNCTSQAGPVESAEL